MKKILILFAYYETLISYENLKYFLEFGVKPFEAKTNIQFIIIVNSETNSVKNVLPMYVNCNFIYVKHSLKAWQSWGLVLNLIDRTKYDYYIFLKDTVKGPLFNSNDIDIDWYEYIVNGIDDQVKMVGLEYLIKPSSIGGSWVKKNLAIYIDAEKRYNVHVTTTVWATDKATLEGHLLHLFMNNSYKKVEFCINDAIIKAGYYIKSLEPRFNAFRLGERLVTYGEALRMYSLHMQIDPELLFTWTKKRHKFIM